MKRTLTQKTLKHRRRRTCRACNTYKELYWTYNPNPKLSGLCSKCSWRYYVLEPMWDVPVKTLEERMESIRKQLTYESENGLLCRRKE